MSALLHTSTFISDALLRVVSVYTPVSLLSCILELPKCEEREKTNKMQQSDVHYQLMSQHVSGIIMPIFRRTKALLLHLVCCSGSAGCGW